MSSGHSLRGFAGQLWRLADMVRVAETRRSFRSKAYRRAVWSLDDLPGLDASEEVTLSTPGIGPGVNALIREYRDTGVLGQLVPLDEAYPLEAPRLRRLPRMTPRMLRDLKAELGVETVDDLRAAIDSEAAATVRGAGGQTLNLWRSVLDLAPDDSSMPAHRAWVTAGELAAHVTRHSGASTEFAGEVRRVEEWVRRLNLVAVTDDPDSLFDFLESTTVLHSYSGDGGETHDRLPVIFHVASPSDAGRALIRATGPSSHVEMLGDMGPAADEERIYAEAGRPWVPPPARGLDPDEAGQVVTVDDLKGDLHLHSESSPDGRMTLDQICDAAIRLGYEYVLITDHTQGLGFGGLDEEAMLRQSEGIAELRSRHPELIVFHGAELNIGQDGTLDLDDSVLERLDFAVAGVHSHFGLGPDEQTARVVTALTHPKVRVLAHPFGRRIGIRPALSIDMDRVIEAAVSHDVALETNGHRDRLDLPAEWVSRAAAAGAVFAANSDGHTLGEMRNIANAVATLQRAGITAHQVVNTLDTAKFRAWLDEGLSGEGGI